MTHMKYDSSRVFLKDCILGMKDYPDGHFDLAVVDPPYGIRRDGQKETNTKNKKHKRKYIEQKSWDKATPSADYFDELFRVSKNQIIWGANYFTQYIPPSMGWVFWDKGQDLSMSDGELAFTSFNTALRRVKINRAQLLAEGGTIHPTQKPIKLYDWIFDKYAKAGDKVLDTHLGSQSSRIAAWKHRLDFTGFELDEDYFNEGCKRFDNFAAQQRLF